MRRLYLQIYLGFIGIALMAILAGATAGNLLSADSPEVPAQARAAAVWLAEDLPPSGDPSLPAALRARSERLALDLQLFDAAGAPLAAPNDAPRPQEEGWGHSRQGASYTVRLPDGRWLRAAFARRGHPSPARFIGVLGAIALAMAIGAYPVARRFTRRLESLRASVEAWGRGALATRAPVQGRDEVAELARHFNDAAERVEALVQNQQRVLAHASHELRSPLARLRMALALIEEEEDPRHRPMLEEANRDIEELDGLIDEVLLAARLEGSATVPRPPDAPVDLAALLAEEAARIGAAVEGDPLVVPGDPVLLRRLIRNLLENAARYGGGGPITAATQAGPGGPRLSVADTGPGVPEADRERIFEPFYRLPGHAEGRHGGVGLGLSLARQIARRHGATLRCEPGMKGGSVFILAWPEGRAGV